jgi:hypothetical protein
LIERVQQLLLHIQQLGQADIAMFTHGQFMQMVLWLVRHPGYEWSAQAMRAWRERMQAEPLHNAQIMHLTYSRRTGWAGPGAT